MKLLALCDPYDAKVGSEAACDIKWRFERFPLLITEALGCVIVVDVVVVVVAVFEQGTMTPEAGKGHVLVAIFWWLCCWP